MKLKSMRIENFQSHKDTTVEFHEGVNVIVGNSDSGKSALMRALHWTLFNKPAGADFRSDWGGSTEVHLDFEDGQIARIRNKKFNGYVLGVDEFKGFGQGVLPEPVEEFVNLDPVNFQSQHDPPFLLSWPPGERGAYINRVANLEDMEKAIANIQKTARSETQQINTTKEAIESLGKEKETYNYLPDMEVAVIEIETKEKRREQIHRRIDKLEGLSRNVRIIDNQVGELIDTLDTDRPVSEIEELAKELMETVETERGISRLINAIEIDEEHIEEYRESVSMRPQVVELTGLTFGAKAAADEEGRVKQIIYHLKSNRDTILTLIRKLREGEDRLHEAMPDICPLCDQEIPK